MIDDRLSRAFTIEDDRAAQALADHRRREILMLFAPGPRTLGEAAAASGKELRRLHHHVGRLCAAGLVEVVGERRRAGRPMKLYRAASDSFFVRDELLARPFMQSLADELAQSMLGHGFSSGRGILYTIEANGDGKAERIDEEEEPGKAISLFFLSHIRPADLPALKEELRAVVERFEKPDLPNSRPYIVHAAAAPQLSASGRDGGGGGSAERRFPRDKMRPRR
jgi:hypothetical protein